jgi:hypothetical protein
MDDELESWEMEDIYDDVEPEQGYTAESILGDDDNDYEEIYDEDDDFSDEEEIWDDEYGVEDTDGIEYPEDFSEDDLTFDDEE